MANITIAEIINKAEIFYKSEGNYESASEVFRKGFLDVKRDMEQKNNRKLSNAVVLQCILKDFTIKTAKHITTIVSFKLEEEAQTIKENPEEYEMMIRVVLEELREFYVSEGTHIKVMSVDEMASEMVKLRNQIRKSNIAIFFLNGWVYFPLSLPFQILKIIWLVCVVIKPTLQEIKKINMEEVNNVSDLDFKKINFKTILQKAEKRMPKITDMDYFYHHIVCGILIWIIIFKMIF